jgi:hypothetical protein
VHAAVGDAHYNRFDDMVVQWLERAMGARGWVNVVKVKQQLFLPASVGSVIRAMEGAAEAAVLACTLLHTSFGVHRCQFRQRLICKFNDSSQRGRSGVGEFYHFDGAVVHFAKGAEASCWPGVQEKGGAVFVLPVTRTNSWSRWR